MWPRTVALALLVSLCATPAVHAEGFVSASQTKLELTARGGYYEEKAFPLEPAGPTALRARIVMSDIDTHPKYLPAVSFAVTNGDAWVSFKLVRDMNGDRPRLIPRFESWRDSKATGRKEYRYVAHVGEATELNLTWRPGGAVSATWIVKGVPESQTLELGLQPKELVIGVSGGHVLIDPLEFGRLN